MFIDEVEIHVRSGKGGDGMVHFRREKYVPKGGPDGGDGGRGGDVVFEVDAKLSTLSGFRPNQRIMAADGGPGGSAQRTGKDGAHRVIRVPPGTVVYDARAGARIGELVNPQDRMLVCKGGRGGRGNQHFATSRNQAPRTAERGEPGQERFVRLELRLIADVGIVGLPNAGKSTLLAAVTNARPKVASYPFTTLEPVLGVARIDDDTNLVLADIPGLIEGAHRGAGLGHDFLRHLQRTRALIHVLDGLSIDPLADFTQINSELALFDSKLTALPQVVAFNKIDHPEARARADSAAEALRKRGVDLIPISALNRLHVQRLLKRVAHVLAEAPPPVEDELALPVYRPREEPGDFEVLREGKDKWRLRGAAIERAASMTYWQHDGSVRRFQKLMERLGVDDRLRESGVQQGDTVAIGDYELEWKD